MAMAASIDQLSGRRTEARRASAVGRGWPIRYAAAMTRLAWILTSDVLTIWIAQAECDMKRKFVAAKLGPKRRDVLTVGSFV